MFDLHLDPSAAHGTNIKVTTHEPYGGRRQCVICHRNIAYWNEHTACGKCHHAAITALQQEQQLAANNKEIRQQADHDDQPTLTEQAEVTPSYENADAVLPAGQD